MKYEKYDNGIYGEKKKSLFGKRFLIFSSFIIVLAVIFLTSFYDGGKITGNVVDSINLNNSIQIKTSLSVPDVSLNDYYENVVFSLKSGSKIYLDNKKINLEEAENNIVLNDFRGDIKFDEYKLKELNGRVSEIIINNLSINLNEGKLSKFSISEDSEYSYLEINGGVYLKNVFFIASGNISFGDDSLNLNSEKVGLKNYLGSLKVRENKLILEGFAQNLNIEGASRKLSISN